VAKGKSAKKKAKPKENALVRYLRDTRAELRKVRWPTREEAWNLTKVVIIVTVAMAMFLGLLNYLFSREVFGIIDRDPIAIGVVVVVLVAGVLIAVILNRQTA
jgi:preprotein translocase subunit SecE